MHNSTPPNPPADEQARAQAEDALKERGWNPITPHQRWDGELAVGRSADDAYEASIWTTTDVNPGMPWICDVGVTPPDSLKRSLWLLGIPRPEEVLDLLKRHGDILSVGHDGHTLDLATGEVLNPEQTRMRLGMAARAEREAKEMARRERKLAPIRKTLQAAWQKLAEGWETYEYMYSFALMLDDMRRMVEIRAIPYCRQDDGVLLLDLAAYYDAGRGGGDGDVWELEDDTLISTGIPLEYFGKARLVLSLSGGAEEIPSPREAMHLMKHE